MLKDSKNSAGVIVLNVPAPTWSPSENEAGDVLDNANSFTNMYTYNFFTLDERSRYRGYSRNGFPANPYFSSSETTKLKNIVGSSIDSLKFYQYSSGNIPSYIKLKWRPPVGISNEQIASRDVIRDFVMCFIDRKPNPDAPNHRFLNSTYSSFEAEQNDFVDITNEYLDIFAGVNDDLSPVNRWFAEEIDSTMANERQLFLWNQVLNTAEKYKNFLFFHKMSGAATGEHANPSLDPNLSEYFGGSLDDNPVYSTADVTDSALLENLSFSHSRAIPADITIIQNAEFAWKTKEYSLGFSGRVLGSQERNRMCNYWVEFLEKYKLKSGNLSNEDIEVLTSNLGGLEATLLKASAYKTEELDFANSSATISEFLIAGYVIEKEQVLENGELDEPGVLMAEKFPLIFIPCVPGSDGSLGEIPNSYLDAAVNYDKEYKYTIRAVYSFSISIELSEVDPPVTHRRSYFVNSPYSSILTVETRETQRPPYPRDLSAFYEHNKASLSINWAFPINKQRDTAYFAIFRRNSIYEPFRLLQIYDFNYSISNPVQSREEIKLQLVYPTSSEDSVNSYNLIKRLKNSDPKTCFSDIISPGIDYIYTVCAIDAHGQMSNYSSQLLVNLDPNSHELYKRQISPPGAPLVFPNWFIKSRSFIDVARTANYRKAIVKFRPDYKKVKIGSNNVVKDIVKCTSEEKGGNLKNCYYLQILNPDRKDDIVLKYQIDDSSFLNFANYEELSPVARLAGLPVEAIERSD